MSLPKDPRQWTKQSDNQSFLISTNHSLLSLPAINAAFASDYAYWATSLPDDILQGIINRSFCFGLYKTSNKTPSEANAPKDESQWPEAKLEQIGFARLATDFYTIAYLTDVYVLPEYQGYGLGGWLLDCVDELVRPLPYLRWFMLRTGSERSVVSYRARFGMDLLDNGDVNRGGVCMGRKGSGNRA